MPMTAAATRPATTPMTSAATALGGSAPRDENSVRHVTRSGTGSSTVSGRDARSADGEHEAQHDTQRRQDERDPHVALRRPSQRHVHVGRTGIDQPPVRVAVDELRLAEVVTVDGRGPAAVVALPEHEPERLTLGRAAHGQVEARAPLPVDLHGRTGCRRGVERRDLRRGAAAGRRLQHERVEVDAGVQALGGAQHVVAACRGRRRRRRDRTGSRAAACRSWRRRPSPRCRRRRACRRWRAGRCGSRCRRSRPARSRRVAERRARRCRSACCTGVFENQSMVVISRTPSKTNRRSVPVTGCGRSMGTVTTASVPRARPDGRRSPGSATLAACCPSASIRRWVGTECRPSATTCRSM